MASTLRIARLLSDLDDASDDHDLIDRFDRARDELASDSEALVAFLAQVQASGQNVRPKRDADAWDSAAPAATPPSVASRYLIRDQPEGVSVVTAQLLLKPRTKLLAAPVTRVRMILRALRGRAQGCAAPIATGRKPPSASPARNAAAVAGIARC
jgi:hypothetical protein